MIHSDEVSHLVTEQYLATMRPATLEELGEAIGVSIGAVRYHLLTLVEEGEVVRLPGARGYMPKWVLDAVAREGVNRTRNPRLRRQLLQQLYPHECPCGSGRQPAGCPTCPELICADCEIPHVCGE